MSFSKPDGKPLSIYPDQPLGIELMRSSCDTASMDSKTFKSEEYMNHVNYKFRTEKVYQQVGRCSGYQDI